MNIGARKIVNKFEELKISLSAISKLAVINMERVLPVFQVTQNPQDVALALREELYSSFMHNMRDFLKALIEKFAENNILVFEFVETWNKKEKANTDGFFLNPNVIVLKRQQTSFRREIFTLIHELGHYSLNKEEIEELEVSNLANRNLSATERWCNDFAFSFLAGPYNTLIDSLDRASMQNDYHFSTTEEISKNTHLSQIAVFTQLLYKKKISKTDYVKVKANFDEQYRLRLEKEEKRKELEKLRGLRQEGRTPKPINSPLLVSTIQTAYYECVIDEVGLCESLNIRPDKLSQYIQ